MIDILKKARNDAIAIFNAGLKSVAPDIAIKRFCQRKDHMLSIGNKTIDLGMYDNIYVVGAGKATAPMAATMEDLLGDHLTGGVIIVKYGHTQDLLKVEMVEAAHPIPDQNGESGSKKILEIAKAAGKKDLIICLISGGGSALLPKAVPGVSLADKQETTRILLACGATIHEINTLRKHLSLIKGGQLAAACEPATVISLILSDVVGDDLDVIASGPTVPDSSTFKDCLKIIEKYKIKNRLPNKVVTYFNKGLANKVPETPKQDDPLFDNTYNFIIGNNFNALLAAKKEAVRRNYKTLILSSMIEGETYDVAGVHTAIAREIVKTGYPIQTPACILTGGETTVRIKGDGLGGRNQEFALCAASHIAGKNPIVILSGGTDGNDGPTDATGAFIDNLTCARAIEKGLNINDFLSNNDSYHFFENLGDLFITGPTKTNVMDLRIIIVPYKNLI